MHKHTYIITHTHACIKAHTYMHMYAEQYNTAMNSRDRYKIIGLHKISHFIKQRCKNVCLKKCYKCIKVAETM